MVTIDQFSMSVFVGRDKKPRVCDTVEFCKEVLSGVQFCKEIVATVKYCRGCAND